MPNQAKAEESQSEGSHSPGSGGIQIKKPQAKKSEALWMMTFSDLSFILMAFFALLLSMSTLDPKKYETITEGFIKETQKEESRNFHFLQTELSKEIKRRGLSKWVQATRDVDGLAIEFKSGLLFQGGSSTLNKKMIPITEQVIQLVGEKAADKYHLSVEGHTDDRGIEAANYRLSANRALAILYRFKEQGVRMEQMKVVAFGSSKPKIDPRPLTGAKLKAARSANRRMVIRIN